MFVVVILPKKNEAAKAKGKKSFKPGFFFFFFREMIPHNENPIETIGLIIEAPVATVRTMKSAIIRMLQRLYICIWSFILETTIRPPRYIIGATTIRKASKIYATIGAVAYLPPPGDSGAFALAVFNVSITAKDMATPKIKTIIARIIIFCFGLLLFIMYIDGIFEYTF